MNIGIIGAGKVGCALAEGLKTTDLTYPEFTAEVSVLKNILAKNLAKS